MHQLCSVLHKSWLLFPRSCAFNDSLSSQDYLSSASESSLTTKTLGSTCSGGPPPYSSMKAPLEKVICTQRLHSYHQATASHLTIWLLSQTFGQNCHLWYHWWPFLWLPNLVVSSHVSFSLICLHFQQCRRHSFTMLYYFFSFFSNPSFFASCTNSISKNIQCALTMFKNRADSYP